MVQLDMSLEACQSSAFYLIKGCLDRPSRRSSRFLHDLNIHQPSQLVPSLPEILSYLIPRSTRLLSQYFQLPLPGIRVSRICISKNRQLFRVGQMRVRSLSMGRVGEG